MYAATTYCLFRMANIQLFNVSSILLLVDRPERNHHAGVERRCSAYAGSEAGWYDSANRDVGLAFADVD